jgi:myo-inositol-1-phosphate synthase
VAPATRRTNHSREREGRLPVYGTVETNLMGEDVRDSQVYTDFDSLAFEIRDALKEIAKTDIEAQILMAENWSLSNAEIAEKLGVSYVWIAVVKARLRERYNRLEKRTS